MHIAKSSVRAIWRRIGFIHRGPPPDGRLGQIILDELKMGAHFERKFLKGLAEPCLEGSAFGAAARQQGLAERDPDGDAPPGTPKPGKDVTAVAAHNGARNYRSAGHFGKPGDAGPQRRPFERRAGAVTDAALGKEADGVAGAQPLEGGAHGLAVEVDPVHRVGVDRPEPRGQERQPEKLDHPHPVDLAAGADADERRIEMADVIRGEDPCPFAPGDFRAQHMDFQKRRHEDFHGQPRDVVKENPHGREAKGCPKRRQGLRESGPGEIEKAACGI